MGYENLFICDNCGGSYATNSDSKNTFKCTIETSGFIVASSYLCKKCAKELYYVANVQDHLLRGTNNSKLISRDFKDNDPEFYYIKDKIKNKPKNS